jgi:hypothetical protein
MKPQDTPLPRIDVSNDGDVLITKGPAEPVLFVSRHRLSAFLSSPQNAVAEIGGVGAAAIIACLEAGGRFKAIADAPLTLQLTLRNGLTVLFSVDESVLGPANWPNVHASDLIVTPHHVLLARPRAVSRLKLAQRTACLPSKQVVDDSSYAKAVTVLVRDAVQKRNSIPVNGTRFQSSQP